VETDQTGADADEKPSKSQRKRDMDALQDLGVQLIALSSDRLGKMDLPGPLLVAVRDAQRFTKHEARRRQLQYIGRLMRSIDPGPIQAALDEINGVSAAANARQHRLEQLRVSLLADESVLGNIALAYPAADLQQLRQLRRTALKEQQLGKPPRAYRELFRMLRELETAAAAEAESAPAVDDVDPAYPADS
jgi:ribosome-associated protein